ncbi:MAG: nucleotidyltransferase domain-containing protein, partial [Thermoplasmata archaeon]
MVEKISEIRKHIEPLKKHALAILLYGSYAEGKATNRSDIDICIVAPS